MRLVSRPSLWKGHPRSRESANTFLMNPTIQTDLAYRLSLFIGPASAPFVFMAAGLQDFTCLQFSHLLIIVCYVFGALGLSQLLLRSCFRFFGAMAACSKEGQGGGDPCVGKPE